MTDKELIKNYKDTYKAVTKKSTEKGKKIYINAFDAFDKKLNKDLDSYIKEINVRPANIDAEIIRIKKVINALHYRLDVRKKMLDDYVKVQKIPLENEYDRLKESLNNLTKAKDIIRELIISGKEIRRIKKNNSVFKKQNNMNKKIDSLIKKRIKLIELLKKAPDIMDDLYKFAIKAPFNEENGYINYLIVKSGMKGKKENEQ